MSWWWHGWLVEVVIHLLALNLFNSIIQVQVSMLVQDQALTRLLNASMTELPVGFSDREKPLLRSGRHKAASGALPLVLFSVAMVVLRLVINGELFSITEKRYR